ncbi:MAG: type IV conjugative transfer system lipoprotein TraV [Citrobacter sp.]
MKKHPLALIASAFLLSGCAGMNSEFSCGATAKDQCITMDEANNKARASSESAVKATTLPPLAARASQSLPPTSPSGRAVAPVATPMPIAAVTSATPAVAVNHAPSMNVTPTGPRNPFSGRSAVVPASVNSVSPASTPARAAPTSGWADIGMAPPVRQSASVARLWIAAWVDEGQVYHQPSVVSFEAKPAHWVVQ